MYPSPGYCWCCASMVLPAFGCYISYWGAVSNGACDEYPALSSSPLISAAPQCCFVDMLPRALPVKVPQDSGQRGLSTCQLFWSERHPVLFCPNPCISHAACAAQVRTSEQTPLLTCLLEGPGGAGKTALAATLGLDSGFPFVKVISSDNMVGFSEAAKAQAIAKVFDDAYRVRPRLPDLARCLGCSMPWSASQRPPRRRRSPRCSTTRTGWAARCPGA